VILSLLLVTQVAVGPDAGPVPLVFVDRLGVSAPALEDTVPRRRPRAIEYSESYYVRLKIHKYASYATIPLFAAEYLTGDHLFKAAENGTRGSGLARSLHAPIALSIGGLFAINSVTGVWNFWEGRKEPKGRARRIIHSVLMLASDAGFLLTAMSAGDAGEGREGGIGGIGNSADGRNRHRSLAITSGSTALVGYLMMLVWKD
jgi:hypothetical protein